jgi:hypothetical protein
MKRRQQKKNTGCGFNRPTCRYASNENLGVITWWIAAVNGKMAMVTLCNLPSPGMLHLPSMIYETDVTSFVITTVSLGWYGYRGGSAGVMTRRLRRRGLRLLTVPLSDLRRSDEYRLVELRSSSPLGLLLLRRTMILSRLLPMSLLSLLLFLSLLPSAPASALLLLLLLLLLPGLYLGYGRRQYDGLRLR